LQPFFADFEWFLAVNGVITDSELTEDPRLVCQRRNASSFVGEDNEDTED
jgi:hypothetical protein